MGRQIAKGAPAFQIIALEVENLDEAIAELRAKDIRVYDKVKINVESPYYEEVYVAMIHPKSSFGLLIELVETK